MKDYRALITRLQLATLVTLSACQTTGNNPPTPSDPAPTIAADMPLEDALKAAVDHSGATIDKVRQLVERRKESAAGASVLEQAISDHLLVYTNSQLISAANLYQSLTVRLSPQLFTTMVRSGRPLARQIAWQMAASLPSSEIAALIDRHLTLAVTEGNEEEVLIPQMAQAIQVNRLRSAFTLLRQGLLSTGDEAFAKAMITLDPARASNDFMDYLSLAPVEELRQLTQKTVNMYTCMVALRHLMNYPVSTNHPKYDQLFLYAVSRNNALAELANMVLNNSFPRHRESMAVILARLPAWIQIAYLEYARRNMSPEVSQFLAALKMVSAQSQVLEEIGEIQR